MPKTRKQTTLADFLDFSQQTGKLLKMVTDIGENINLIKEHSYKLFDLDLESVKGKAIKELVGSMMDAANSVVRRATTGYDIFDIGVEINKYEALLKEYRELVANKVLIVNVERGLEEFRSSFRAVYKGGGASAAYELIVTANDLVKHIEILGYALAQPKSNETKEEAPIAHKANKPKGKQGRKKKIKPEISLAIEAEISSAGEPNIEPVEEPNIEPAEEPSIEPVEEPIVAPIESPIEEPNIELTEGVIAETSEPVKAQSKRGRKKKTATIVTTDIANLSGELEEVSGAEAPLTIENGEEVIASQPEEVVGLDTFSAETSRLEETPLAGQSEESAPAADSSAEVKKSKRGRKPKVQAVADINSSIEATPGSIEREAEVSLIEAEEETAPIGESKSEEAVAIVKDSSTKDGKTKRGRKAKGEIKIVVQEEVSEGRIVPLIEDLAGDKIIKVVKDPVIGTDPESKPTSLEISTNNKVGKSRGRKSKVKVEEAAILAEAVDAIPVGEAETVATNQVDSTVVSRESESEEMIIPVAEVSSQEVANAKRGRKPKTQEVAEEKPRSKVKLVKAKAKAS